MKVYVTVVKDSPETNDVDPAVVKAKLEEALTKRKSIHFQIVEKPEDAEFFIESKLKGFLWTDHDPVDM